MQIDEIRAWGGVHDRLPEEFRGKAGPFELSMTMFEELSKIFDVAIMNHIMPKPTRAERGRGVKQQPPRRVLWLDTLGGGFRTR